MTVKFAKYKRPAAIACAILLLAMTAMLAFTLQAASTLNGEIPVGVDWVSDKTQYWFNWAKMCSYYQFTSQTTSAATLTWVRNKFSEASDWQKGMEMDSEQLVTTITKRQPSIEFKVLQEQLRNWSVPHFGAEYGVRSSAPFSVIVRSRSLGNVTKHIHVKISEATGGSLIEIWNYSASVRNFGSDFGSRCE